MKHWQEYYFAKHIEKHFGGINIGDQGKIISFVCLKLPLGINFIMRVLCKWHGRFRSQNTLWNMYICKWTRAAFVDIMCQKISVLQ